MKMDKGKACPKEVKYSEEIQQCGICNRKIQTMICEEVFEKTHMYQLCDNGSVLPMHGTGRR